MSSPSSAADRAGLAGSLASSARPALRQARRLVVRVQTPGRLRRAVPVLGGAHAVARDFEEHGDLRQAIALLAVALPPAARRSRG